LEIVGSVNDERRREMAKQLDNDTAPKSGRGSEQDRLSQSPLEIRRGSAVSTS
jgi:hypothetical protein